MKTPIKKLPVGEWIENQDGSETIFDGGWDADEHGNEWDTAYTVMKTEDQDGWEVDYGDGEGNGNYLATFRYLCDARAFVNVRVNQRREELRREANKNQERI